MSGCKCDDPRVWTYGPCDYCSAEWCDICDEPEANCDCSYCEACDSNADHETAMHKFDEDELWCWEKFGCLEKGEHYHTEEINAMTGDK